MFRVCSCTDAATSSQCCFTSVADKLDSCGPRRPYSCQVCVLAGIDSHQLFSGERLDRRLIARLRCDLARRALVVQLNVTVGSVGIETTILSLVRNMYVIRVVVLQHGLHSIKRYGLRLAWCSWRRSIQECIGLEWWGSTRRPPPRVETSA